MQRLANQLIGDVRAVEITGVYVVHATRHCFAQNCQRCVTIFRRTENARAGELHRAVA